MTLAVGETLNNSEKIFESAVPRQGYRENNPVWWAQNCGLRPGWRSGSSQWMVLHTLHQVSPTHGSYFFIITDLGES